MIGMKYYLIGQSGDLVHIIRRCHAGFLVKLLADVIKVHEEIRFGNLLERQTAVLKVFRDIVLNLMHHRTAFGGNPGGLRQPGEALQDHFLKILPVLLMFHLDQPFRELDGG